MKKAFLYFCTFALFYILFLSASAQATSLSDAAGTLAPGQWTKVTGMTNLQATAAIWDQSGAVAQPGPGYDGPQPGWNSIKKKILLETTEHGAGLPGCAPPQSTTFPALPHTCWKQLVTYDDTTNTWTTGGPYPINTSGGTPVNGVHSYGHVAWDDTNEVMYVRKYDLSGNLIQFYRYCTNANTTYCISQGANTWKEIAPMDLSAFGGNTCCEAIGWHPTLNGGTLLYIAHGSAGAGCGAIFGYNPGTNVWRTVDPGTGCKFNTLGLSGSYTIPSTVKGVVMFGGGGGAKWWKIAAGGTNGVVTQLDSHPNGCVLGTTDGRESNGTVDPVSGDAIFIGCTFSGQMWRLNPTAAPGVGAQWTLIDGNLGTAGKICNVVTQTTRFCGWDFAMTPISTYGVIGAWKMTNSSSPRLTAEYWIYKVSAGGGDITPPTVSMTVPASGATVSGVATTVSATASDNVGVAGVQFKLDGVALGTEDTATPFSISWNTTTASNGVHTLTATARDAAGNSTTSAGVNVTVSNAGGSDFTTRCTAAIAAGGRCIPFDASSEIANTTWGGNTGLDLGFNGGKPPPVIDTTVKASGAGSLKFTISSQSLPNGAGAYWANFSTDLSARYGAGQSFYIQWRQRFSPEQLSNIYNAVGGGMSNGWKTADITTGDRAGSCTSAEAVEGCQNQLGVAAFTSCTAIELVTQNVLFRGFLQAYQSCTGSSSRPFAYAGFTRQYPSGIIPLGMDCGLDCYLQDATATPFCLYSQRPGVGSGFFPPNGNCIQFVANEWMTFKVKITIGPRGSGFVPGASPNDEFVNSNFEMWIAREGQPSIKAFNYGPFNMSAGSTTADLKFGKVYLEPYNTNKDATQVHPTAFTWYDELIISPQDIADPGITDTTNPTVAITSPIPPTASTTTSPITVSGTASDNVSVTSVTWTCVACVTKGGTATSSPGPSISWFIPALDFGSSAGSFTLNVIAHDAAGNVSTAASLIIAYSPTGTYWVSKSGNDSNGCANTTTPQTTGAKLTIAAGIGCLASGNTLMIRAGTYAESITDTQFAGKSGSGSGNNYTAPTTVRAYSTEVVQLDGSIGFNAAGVGIVSYVIFQGDPIAKNFIVNGNGSGNNGTIQVGQAGNTGNNHHIKFDGLDVRNGAGGAGHAGAVTVGEAAASDIWFTNMRVHNFGSVADSCNSGGPSPHAFYIQGPNTIIENTEIYNVPGYGIHNYDQLPGGPGGHASNNIYRNNYIHNTGGNQPPACLQTVFAIGLVSGSGHAAYNNILANNTNGMDIANSNNSVIYSNTLYANIDSSGTCCYPGLKHNSGSGNTFRNNLLFGNAINQFDITGASSVTASKNICSGGCDLTTIQTAAQIFINAPAGDFRLRAGSAAIDVGFTLPSPYNVDALNIARPQGTLFDLGAYETGVFVPPVVTIVNPTANPTLSVTQPLFSLGGTSNLP